MYNAFLFHYTTWSIVLAVIALPCTFEFLFFPHVKVSDRPAFASYK